MEATRFLLLGLQDFKENVIGIFIPNYDRNSIQFIIENDGTNLTVIKIGKWLGVCEEYTFVNMGKVIMFENNMNMNQLLENPFLFNEFLKMNDF